MAKQKRSLTRGITSELSRRAKSEVASKRDYAKSNLRTSLESLLPQNLRWLLPFVTDFRPEAVEAETETLPETPIAPTDSPIVLQHTESLYPQYHCRVGDPLNCLPTQAGSPDTPIPYCTDCGFPALLTIDSEIRGNRGRYRITGFRGRRGHGRLYEGVTVPDSQPVVIKEYLLPTRCFSEPEIRQQKAAFAQLAGLDAVDGRVQDFRLISPWEAIADHTQERCYLVHRGNLNTQLTLGSYLHKSGPMTANQVRHILNQVLQTLEFLHGQKFRLPAGQMQPGLAHGNLSLDSLLIYPMPLSSTASISLPPASPPPSADTNFHIYVCDVALWETLLDPAQIRRSPTSPAQDLADLGTIAFYLLVGHWLDPLTSRAPDPDDAQQWPPVQPELKAFILRLLGRSVPFDSAAAARRTILQMPSEKSIAGAIVPLEDESDTPIRSPRWPWFVAGAAALALVGALLGWLLSKPQAVASGSQTIAPCCINKVPAVPEGTFTYTAAQSGTWNYVLQQDNLINPGRTLAQELQDRRPKLQLLYRPEASGEAAIARVEAEQRTFALTSLTQLNPDLESQPVAYDGLVVFVSFSYARRSGSLPNQLHGQITLDQLRQLYTGQITNWQQLGGPDLPVKLYAPDEPEALRLFEQRVLQTDAQIADFRRLLPAANAASSLIRPVAAITQQSTFQTLRDVIRDFEDQQVGAIAFGTLSKVFGQCSVYPLAVVNGKVNVQALVQANGNPITPATDLCNAKGRYHPDNSAIQTGRYPLAYPLAVVYPRDNSLPPAGEKFAEMLKTQEGQTLLKQTGLIPLTGP